MQNSPSISIVVPVYNAAEYLPRCLNSLLKQSLQSIEIIAINDGSTDNSLTILNEYAKKDVRIKVFSHNNHGVAYTRQKGLELVQTPYLMWCDSDDWYAPTMCEEMLAAIQADEVDVAKCNIVPVDETDNLKRTDSKDYYKIPFVGFKKLSVQNKLKINVSLVSTIFKMSIIHQYNISFPISLKAHEDDAFTFMYFAVANGIKCIEKDLYYYWRRSDSLTPFYLADGLKNFDRTLLTRPIYDFLIKHDLWEQERQIFYKKYCGLFSASWLLATKNQKLDLLKHETNWVKTFFNFKDVNILPTKYKKLPLAILANDVETVYNLIPVSKQKWKVLGIRIGRIYEFYNHTCYKILGITVYIKRKEDI